MHLTGVNNLNIFLLFFLLSSMLLAKEIVIHEINKINNIILSNGSSITQGGLTITKTLPLSNKNSRYENNNSISQGIITVNGDKNSTNVDYSIINVIHGYPLEES